MPFAYDQYDEIFDVIEYLNARPDLGERIALAGQKFAEEYLVEAGRDCYVLTFLKEYNELLTFPVGNLAAYPNAVTLEEAIEKSQIEYKRLKAFEKTLAASS